MPHDYLKMNGIGNDFVIVDCRENSWMPDGNTVKLIANRQTGPGCDQLILLEHSDDADVFMRIFNSSGEEVGACGNGARCVAHLLLNQLAKPSLTIATASRRLEAQLINVAGEDCGHTAMIAVDMGEPLIDARQIPLSDPELDTGRFDYRFLAPNAPLLTAPAAVNMGNPHVIFFVDNLADYDLTAFGVELENLPLLPRKANISLGQVCNRQLIKLSVWERGAGLTKACGSAACAVVVAGVRNDLADRQATVKLPGGDLAIHWRTNNNHVIMTGPSVIEHRGSLQF